MWMIAGMTTSSLLQELAEAWDLRTKVMLTIDALLHLPLCRLGEVETRAPGLYAHYYRGPLALYEVAMGWPLYFGSAKDLRERSRRYVRQLLPVHEIDVDDIRVAVIPLPTYAAALCAERAAIDLMAPVWGQSWLAGYGSKHYGRNRTRQTPPPWCVVHPGRPVGDGVVPVDRATLERMIVDHLRATVPPGAGDLRRDLLSRGAAGSGPGAAGQALALFPSWA